MFFHNMCMNVLMVSMTIELLDIIYKLVVVLPEGFLNPTALSLSSLSIEKRDQLSASFIYSRL